MPHTILATRVAKLEQRSGLSQRVARIISVSGGPAIPDAEMWAFLATHGMEERPGDLVIHRCFLRPAASGPVTAAERFPLSYEGTIAGARQGN